ncbi:MAG: insulinase family protein [Burkholderiales bacterium]|nr:insulinase family protein [Burkholderiales bacterium]
MKPSARRLPALLLGLLVAAAASAQPFETPPPPAAPRPLTIAAPVEQALPNGLRVIVAPREGVPLVTAMLVVLSGSELDPPQLSGLASMTASLLTQGTRRHTAPQIAAAAEALGGSLESDAGWSQSLVAITVTTPRLGAALGLVAEVTREPTFAEAELDRLRTQTLDALKVRYADPGSLAGLTAARLVYGSGPWGHPASGTPASLPRIRQADLVALHRATFRPDRAVLILAGDIAPDRALALARTHFGDWAAPVGVAPPRPPAPPSLAAGPALAVVDMPAAGQAGVVLALPLPPRLGAERAAADVLDAVIGGGYSSRLSQEIRIKRGLSYSVFSRIEARGASGLFQAALQTKNESAAEVVSLLQGELDRVVQAPVPADELASRKLSLIGSFSRSVETTAGLASAIRSLVASGRSPADLKTRIATLEAVAPEDVQRYAATHFGAAGRRIAVAGVADRFATALRGGAPGLVVVGQEQLDLERPGGLKHE